MSVCACVSVCLSGVCVCAHMCVLQDQLTTTSSNYERQLSTMSDHLCELNDKMMQQTEELELLRKNKVYTKLMSMQVHVYKFLKGATTRPAHARYHIALSDYTRLLSNRMREEYYQFTCVPGPACTCIIVNGESCAFIMI